jgi:pyruvate-formate lyase-activating enzyme
MHQISYKMKTTELLDNTNLYRLPYSKNDNPNGWIEITTYCNMKCNGCYKGIDRDDINRVHEPLEKIKNEIFELKKIRNCGIITISGGEALMHPDILKVVSFIKANKLHSFIHTNGLLLKEEEIVELKNAGLTGFIVRVDSLNRSNNSEFELNKVRQQYADLIKKIGDLQLGFTSVINQKNLEQIPDVVKWFQSNNNKVDYLVLILKRDFIFESQDLIDKKDWVFIEQLGDTLATQIPGLEFASYLGSQQSDLAIKWLHAAWIAHDGKVLGFCDKKMVEFSTVFNHFKYGNYSYAFFKERNKISFFSMLIGSFFLRKMRSIFKCYMISIFLKPSSIFKIPTLQVINIVNPPGESNGNRDFCDACPDAVLYNGKLQPS